MHGQAKNIIQMKRVKDLKVGDICYAVSLFGVVVKLEVYGIGEMVEDKKVITFDKGFIGIGYNNFCSLEIHHTDSEKLFGYGMLKTLNTRIFLEKETAIDEINKMIGKFQFCIEKLKEEE